MTDKEFKRLNRAQLIEIIYQLQLQVEGLTEEKETLEKALEDKRLRLEKTGNIAEAALEINNCFRNAQNAAEQYLNEIKEVNANAKIQSQKIIDEASMDALSIISASKKGKKEYDSLMKTMAKKYGQDISDNG